MFKEFCITLSGLKEIDFDLFMYLLGYFLIGLFLNIGYISLQRVFYCFIFKCHDVVP